MYYVPCTISVQMVLENENLYEAYMYLWIGIRNLKRFNEYFVCIYQQNQSHWSYGIVKLLVMGLDLETHSQELTVYNLRGHHPWL